MTPEERRAAHREAERSAKRLADQRARRREEERARERAAARRAQSREESQRRRQARQHERRRDDERRAAALERLRREEQTQRAEEQRRQGALAERQESERAQRAEEQRRQGAVEKQRSAAARAEQVAASRDRTRKERRERTEEDERRAEQREARVTEARTKRIESSSAEARDDEVAEARRAEGRETRQEQARGQSRDQDRAAERQAAALEADRARQREQAAEEESRALRATRAGERQRAEQRRESLAPGTGPGPARLQGGELSGSLPWLSVRGVALVDELEVPVTLRGASATGFERLRPQGMEYAPVVSGRVLDALAAAGACALTIPIAQDAVLVGREGAPPAAYLAALDATIEAAAGAGLHSIVQLALLSGELPSAPGETEARFAPPLPDLDSLELWRILAHRYAREPAVIFDLFRSPHDPEPGDPTEVLLTRLTWPLWRRWALAMLGAVREEHPRALVIVKGLDYGHDLSGFPLLHSDGSVAPNLLYATTLNTERPGRALREMAGLRSIAPVGAFDWTAHAHDLSTVESLGRRLARGGYHWTTAALSGPQMTLFAERAGQLVPTPLGRAVARSLAQPSPVVGPATLGLAPSGAGG